MNHSATAARDSHRFIVFSFLAAVYFLVYFHRVSTSVIAQDLLIAFKTDATALGIMSSMYFYIYAAEQPFVGYLSDRFGPRRIVGIWTVIAALGCIVFGFAPTISLAAVGRALIGFGVGGVYVPALKAFSLWFRKRNFATLTGIFLAAGNLGAIVATTPLVWINETWGWRNGFFIIGAISLSLALGTFFMLRDRPRTITDEFSLEPQEDDSPITKKDILRILSSFSLWSKGIILFGSMGTVITLQGLWATPFLMSVFSLDLSDASRINMLIPVGFIASAPFWGWIGSNLFRRKWDLMIALLILLTGIWSVLTFIPHTIGIIGMMTAMCLFGAAACGIATTMWSIVHDTTPRGILGATSGLLNPFPLFGIAFFQTATGAILDLIGQEGGIYPPGAYKSAFFLCLASCGACLALSLAARYRR